MNQNAPLLNRIALAPTTNPKEKVNPYIWETVCNAMRENHVIKFKYKNNNWDRDLGADVFLHVRPYQLLIDEGKNLLFGYLEEKEAVRLFVLNNMSYLTDTLKPFVLPKDYEFKNHTGNSNFGAFTRYQPRKYRIAFYEDAVEDILQGNWAKDQTFEPCKDENENDMVIVSFTSAQDMKILDWVCQNKVYAKPLEPESLVTRWKFNVAEMARMAGYDIQPDYSLLDKADKLEREGK
ncbi:MAG: WYL domain-containing protein [Treponema sp.]|nr:WYL domain-containing protein [Treponema sp.]